MGPYPCIPSGPAVMYTAATGRTQDCTRPPRQNINLILAMREPSTQDIRRRTKISDFVLHLSCKLGLVGRGQIQRGREGKLLLRLVFRPGIEQRLAPFEMKAAPVGGVFFSLREFRQRAVRAVLDRKS